MDEWKWSNRGVNLQSDHLLWYEDLGATAYASGGGSTQSFEEFLRLGPPVEGIPPEIIDELTLAVRRRLRDGGELPAAVENTEEGPDFDQLSRTANAPEASMDAKSALYAAAFQLKDWLFIARGDLPDVQPYIASNPSIADGAATVKAFTDGRRLHAFARECELTDPDGGVQMLALPVKSILPTLAGYGEQGVTHIHFNADQGSDGFYAPITQLSAIRQYLENNGFL